MRNAEWLETDGLGGFAMGCVDGIRRRRYHGLLIAATTPPTGRMMLLNGFEATVVTSAGRFELNAQRYAPDVIHPTPQAKIESFTQEPWPTWTLLLPDGTRLRQEIFMAHGRPVTCCVWRVLTPATRAMLEVRLFLSDRDYHSLHHENPSFAFEPESRGDRLTWRPYRGVPAIAVLSNARYRHEPQWYRSFLYEQERARGLDDVEDLAAPGVLEFTLDSDEAVCVFAADVQGASTLSEDASAAMLVSQLRQSERQRRESFPSPIHQAADAYLVQRGDGLSIVAGYPWFTDWGRDTFIAMRGLCLATGRLDDARKILLAWADTVSQGMIPNRFPDGGDEPEFNAVDASLWYVVAVGEFLDAARAGGMRLSRPQEAKLAAAVSAIVEGYARGTRYGIRMDADGLIAAGVPGQQLTWMDARSGGREVTPRIGKPVEVQALWYNALAVAGRSADKWQAVGERCLASFMMKFWNEARGCLHDVVDADHVPGRCDPSLRPNQILAVGGLPLAILTSERAARVIEVIERELLTPLGLRTLAPGEPEFVAHYGGGPEQRDAAYHQGTAWPWLMGAFVNAWLRVRGSTPEARREARQRFVQPLLDHLNDAGLGHVSEIADAVEPFTPNGCPFQAWSMGELLRMGAMTETSELQRQAPTFRKVVRA